MPARLIRDDLLDSERIHHLPVEGRWLYVTCLLVADDVGLLELSAFKLHRKSGLAPELVAKLLPMLCDEDLLRTYQASGKTWGFIPRFRQRLQIKRSRCPLPPPALVGDDEWGSKKIKDLAAIPAVDSRDPPKSTAGQRSEPEPEPEERVSDEANASSSSPASPPTRRAVRGKSEAPPYAEIVAEYHDTLPELPRVRVQDGKLWEARKRAMGQVWAWLMTSERPDGGGRRATDRESGLAWFRRYFTRVRSSDWLMGRSAPGRGHEKWRCDIDFLLSPRGMKEVIEKTEEPS